MSAETATATIKEGLDTLEHILNAPPELPRLAWEPLHKEFIVQLYTALRERIDAEIRDGIAHGRSRLADSSAPIEAAAFFGDLTERLHGDYAKNYYYMARRFYPADSMEPPDSDDSDYDEQIAEHKHYMSLPAPTPHPLEAYPQFAECGDDIARVAYEMYDGLLHDLHTSAIGYALHLKENLNLESAAAGGCH